MLPTKSVRESGFLRRQSHQPERPTLPIAEDNFMPFSKKERDSGSQAELAEAYGLLREFWYTIENSMEGDHPARERLEKWLSRFETRITPTIEE